MSAAGWYSVADESVMFCNKVWEIMMKDNHNAQYSLIILSNNIHVEFWALEKVPKISKKHAKNGHVQKQPLLTLVYIA